MINSVPSIDSVDQEGKTINEVKGELVFEDWFCISITARKLSIKKIQS